MFPSCGIAVFPFSARARAHMRVRARIQYYKNKPNFNNKPKRDDKTHDTAL